MPAPSRIEAFAIISADGKIADAAGHMPAALKIDADQEFFQAGWTGQPSSSMGAAHTKAVRMRRGAVDWS